MLMDSERAVLTESAKVFHADFDSLPVIEPGEELTVTIRVKRKRALPEWKGLELTHEQPAQHHGAHEESLAKVHSFAAAHGLEVIATRPHSREVMVRGAAREMQQAFSASLRVAEINGRKCRVRRGEIFVP